MTLSTTVSMPFNIALAISGCPWIPADCFRCSTCALTNVLPRLTLDLVHGIRNMDTTKLSSKGQVVLPKSVRDQHGWGEGTEFVVESTAQGVLLRPRQADNRHRDPAVTGDWKGFRDYHILAVLGADLYP